jgi:twitching motility protein PilT
MINYMNMNLSRHIITLEDPIEYLHSHNRCIIQQREVGFDTQSFSLGLRAALRQDPDVILIGEIRDLETIQTALTAAETGHLVLGTLHTTDAMTTVDRIIDVFPPEQQGQVRIQLATELAGVISQRLFPTADYQNRRAAVEIMINTSAVSHLIRQQKVYQIPSIIHMNQAAGMQTMEASIRELLRDGDISAEAAEPYLIKEY